MKLDEIRVVCNDYENEEINTIKGGKLWFVNRI